MVDLRAHDACPDSSICVHLTGSTERAQVERFTLNTPDHAYRSVAAEELLAGFTTVRSISAAR
jgi:hypothetical protein